MEQLAQPLLVDAQVNQFQQQPFVFLLANRQPGKAQQLADQHHGHRLPRAGLKPGDPHRQRPPRHQQPIVHALAVPIELFARAGGQTLVFQLQVAIQAGPPQKHIHFQQLGLVGNPLGRPAAGHGTGEIELRRPIQSVQIAPGVQRLLPGGSLNVRHAVFIARRREVVSRRLRRDRFHARSVSDQQETRSADGSTVSRPLRRPQSILAVARPNLLPTRPALILHHTRLPHRQRANRPSGTPHTVHQRCGSRKTQIEGTIALGPPQNGQPTEIATCGGGSSRACGAFCAPASADPYLIS
jgi:hypothetical protein